MSPRWSARAADQLLAAISFLESERPGTGRELQASVDELVVLLLQFPQAFPLVPESGGGEVRRALLPRWSYWLIFELHDDGAVVILAFWHGHRRPDGWPTD